MSEWSEAYFKGWNDAHDMLQRRIDMLERVHATTNIRQSKRFNQLRRFWKSMGSPRLTS